MAQTTTKILRPSWSMLYISAIEASLRLPSGSQSVGLAEAYTSEETAMRPRCPIKSFY